MDNLFFKNGMEDSASRWFTPLGLQAVMDTALRRLVAELRIHVNKPATDNEVKLAFLSVYRTGVLAKSPAVDAFFRTMIARSDFTTKMDEGILYSGLFYWVFEKEGWNYLRLGSADKDLSKKIAGDPPLETVRMKQLAEQKEGKVPIYRTPGGAWLDAWTGEGLVGKENYGGLWRQASEEYVRALQGRVDVYLSYPLAGEVYRSTEGGLLYCNEKVTHIEYYIEHPTHEPVTADPGLGPGPKTGTRKYGKEKEKVITFHYY